MFLETRTRLSSSSTKGFTKSEGDRLKAISKNGCVKLRREVTDARSALEVYDCALFCAEKVGDKVNEIGEVDDTEVEDSSPPPPIAKSALEAHVPGSLLAFGDDKTATVYALALTPYALQHPESQCTVRALVKPTRTEPWSLYAPTLLEIAGVETKEDRPEDDDLVRALAASAVGDKEAARLLAPAMEVLLPGRVEATIGSGEAARRSRSKRLRRCGRSRRRTAKCRAAAWDPYHQVLSGPASAQLLWGPGGLSCDGNPAGDGRGEVELVRGDRLSARGVLHEEGVRLLPVLLRPGGHAQGLVASPCATRPRKRSRRRASAR